MVDMTTENGLIIRKIDQPDGGFIVQLDRPQGETFASIQFDDSREQWTWERSQSSALTDVIGWADQAFVKEKRVAEERQRQLEERRRKKGDRLNAYWEMVIEVYGGKDED